MTTSGSSSNFSKSNALEEDAKQKLIEEDDVMEESDPNCLCVPQRPSVTFPDDHHEGESTDVDPKSRRTLPRRSSEWSRAPGEAQNKRKRQLNSLLNATAFPLFMAILVTVAKDGRTYTFYTALMPLLFVGVALQIGIAIAIVVRNGLAHIENPLDVEAGNIAKKQRIVKLKSRFDLWLQIATTLSIALNLSVNAFFAARTPADGETSTDTT